MSTLRYRARRIHLGSYSPHYSRARIDYDWERDFPVPLQGSSPDGSSDFVLEFQLDDEDREDFRKTVKSHLSGNLILSLKFFKNGVDYDVVIPGRAKKTLKKKYEQISDFLRRHINFQYIPAVRTTGYTIDIVESLLSTELASLEEDHEYQEFISKISKAQQPVLKLLARRLTKSISEFVPDVKEIELNTSKTLRRAISRSCRVLVDDGVKTDLEQKGDGIKSLIAISLVKHSTRKSSKQRSLILAIEEPESHLHPAAIHRLVTVLNEISSEQQVIITTHSALLVDRTNINNNLLVNKSRAKVAAKISEIRNILGIQVSDNLISANWVLLVEGTEDGKLIKTWIAELSPELNRAFENGSIIIEDLQGGTNLSYKISQYKNLMCNTFAYLDDDSVGHNSFMKAKSMGLIDYGDVIFSTFLGRSCSEIEDLIIPAIYVDAIHNKYGVKLSGSRFKKNNRIWSDRVSDLFRFQGKPWNDNIEAEVKNFIAELVAQTGTNTLNQKGSNSIKNLVKALKNKLNI